MATDKTVNELIINKLTQAQFDAIPEAERSDTELYFITDAEISGGKGAQVEEMPEAVETNAGQIVQYVGETISDKDTTTITQVVGNSLTNLKVDSKKFAEKLGITAAETVEFTHNINRGFNNTLDYIYPEGNAVSVVITNPTLLLTAIEQFLEQHLEYYPQHSFDNVTHITFEIEYSEEKSQNIVMSVGASFKDNPFTSYGIADYIRHDLDEEHIGVVVGDEYIVNELWSITFDLLNQVYWKNDNIDVVLPSDSTIQFTTTKGNITFECGYQDFINYLTDTSIIPRNWKNEDIPEYLLKSSFTYNSGNNCWVYPPLAGIDDSWVRNFMQISGDVQDGDSVDYVLTLPNEGNIITNIKQYGITYSGTPSTDDKIKIDYYPPVSSYEKGYFYTNKEQLTSPEIIITQTTGNSLSNLKIDEDMFIKAENPTSDLTTTFRVASGGTSYEIEEKIGDYELSIDVSKVVAFAIDKLHSELKYGFLNGEQLRITIQDYRNQPDNSAYPWWVDIWTPSTGTINVGNRMATYWLTDIFGVDFDAESINDIGTLVFSCYYSEPTWVKNDDSQVTLSDYGISFDKGVPALGDVITVDYKSPTYYGMSWEQINVQPSTSSANNIEWVTILDVPADFSPDYRAGCSPIWSVPADLPDGTYEFYVQTLCGSGDPVAIGLYNYTVKVLVKFYTDSGNRYYTGSISYVLDGSWTGDEECYPGNMGYSSCFIIDENNLYFSVVGSFPFSTNLPHYVGRLDVPGAFKISAWKNIESGEQYIPQGTLFEGRYPTGNYLLGSLQSYQLWPGINYPCYHNYFNVDINSDYQYISIIPREVFNGAYCQELVIYMKSSSGGEYRAVVRSRGSSCFIQECEASGDLANVQLGLDGNHNSYIYINDKNNSVSHIEIQLSASGIADTTRNVYLEYDWYTIYNFVPLSVYNVGAPVTKGNLDRILQYTQESTDEYTQGYFYKSVGDIIDIPERLTLVKIPESDFEISLVDDKDVISILSSLTGWSIERITQNLKYAQFAYFYGAGNPYIWCNMFGDLYDQELLYCFNVIPESEAPDGYPQYVEFMLQYIPASQEIENGRWEQVNVQPASEGGLTKEEADQTYLPLSGGELNPSCSIIFSGYKGGAKYSLRVNSTDWLSVDGGFSAKGIYPYNSNGCNLGESIYCWDTLYAKKINTGGDNSEQKYLRIPEKNGTLACLEDIPEGTQLETLPVASADNLNKIYQYVGETTSDYINGHFYKCVEASVTKLTMMNSFMNGASATLDQEKFLAQNPVFADSSTTNTPFPAWRADYRGDGTWNVWTQTPNLTIDSTELADVWGITISGELQEYDMLAVMKQEEMGYAWKEVALGNSTADIPAHPTTPGAYTLMCYVDENGSASYAWENVA